MDDQLTAVLISSYRSTNSLQKSLQIKKIVTVYLEKENNQKFNHGKN